MTVSINTNFAGATYDYQQIWWVDGNWAKFDFNGSSEIVVFQGRAVCYGYSSGGALYQQATPSADYEVQVGLKRRDQDVGNILIFARTTSVNSGYYVNIGGGQLSINKIGVGSALASLNNGSLATDVVVRFRLAGARLSVYIDASTTPILSVVDPSPITAIGYGGIWTNKHEQYGYGFVSYAVEDFVGVDYLPPTLSSASVSVTGSTTATLALTTTDGNGSLRYLRSIAASASDAEIKAGAQQVVTAAGAQSVALTGMSPSTAYYVHVLHTDAGGNDSAALHLPFTTQAPPSPPSGAVTSTVVSGRTVTVSGTTSGVVDSGSSSLVPAGTANGAVAQGPQAVVVGAGTFTSTFTNVQPGSYAAPTVVLMNGGGTATVSGTAFEILAIGGQPQAPNPSSPAAPAITSATGTGGTLSATGTCTVDQTGTLFFKADAGATATDPGAGNEAAAGWLSQSITSAGAQAVNFGSQPAGQRYPHFFAVNGTTGRGAVANGAAFAVTSVIPPITPAGGILLALLLRGVT